MKAEAEKRKAEGTFGKEMDAPKGFNEKPEDAENFQPVAIKPKSKKRTLDEAKSDWVEPPEKKVEDEPQNNGKRLKD